MSADIPELDGVPLTHHQVTLSAATGAGDGLSMHVVEAGPADGTPVVLLHGFPDFWYGWRRQIPLLAKAGYRVFAPDQRGYGDTDKPRPTRAYRVDHLAQDVVALLDHFGASPAHIVGHDWGGGVAWTVAALHPDRVRTLTVMNCPRPVDLLKGPLKDPKQLMRSWYILFFQLPWLPQRLLARGAALDGLVSWSRPGTFTEQDLKHYAAAYTVDAMRGAVSWYRAALFHPGPDVRITPPTLILWGDRDKALGPGLADLSLQACDDGRLERLPDVGHWTPHDAPARTTALLKAHLRAHGDADPLLYKLVPKAMWEEAPEAWEGAPVDLADGFVHLSAHHQVKGTLDKHFVGVEDLLLVGIDPGALPTGSLRWEVSRGGARFPHVYGALPKGAARRVVELAMDADGGHGLPAGW